MMSGLIIVCLLENVVLTLFSWIFVNVSIRNILYTAIKIPNSYLAISKINLVYVYAIMHVQHSQRTAAFMKDYFQAILHFLSFCVHLSALLVVWKSSCAAHFSLSDSWSWASVWIEFGYRYLANFARQIIIVHAPNNKAIICLVWNEYYHKLKYSVLHIM